MKMDSCSVARKEFQRAHVWEKFKHSGKIFWGEGKEYTLGDVEGGQALVATALRSLIILHIFSWFSRTSRLFFQTIQPTSWVFLGMCWVFPLTNPFPGPSVVPHLYSIWFFSQARLPLYVTLWLLLQMPQSSASHLVFTVHVLTSPCTILVSTVHEPSKGTSPDILSLPLSNSGGTSCPPLQGDGKVISSCPLGDCLGIKSLQQKRWSPGGPVNVAAS